MSRPARRLRGALVYAAYLLAIAGLVSWAVQCRWVQSIRPARFGPDVVIPGIDAHLRSQLGSIPAPAERTQAFANFPRDKPPGRIRIGCFGDSFTWGSEVENGNDYPAILQQLLRDLGRDDVEVLSFGSSGFGLHQSVLLWERVGREYGLDHVVLLGLGGMWVGRDSTFHLWDPPGAKLGFHARYVLAGDDLELAEVIGNDEPERFDAYMRFVPHLRYARYDRRAPSFLQAWIPSGRELPNPLYYRRDLGSEIDETYRRLLRRLGRDALGAMLVDIDGKLAGLAEQTTDALPAVRLPPLTGFPYRAQHNHFGPLGNRLVATTVLHALGFVPGPAEGPIRVLPAPVPGEPEGVAMALRDAIDVDVALDDHVVAGFYRRPRRGAPIMSHRLRQLDPTVARLLAVVGTEQSLLDASFLPLESTDGAVTVALSSGASAQPIDVAVTPVGSPGLGLLRIDPCASPDFRRVLDVDEAAHCEPIGDPGELPPGRSARLLVDGKPRLAIAVVGRDRVVLAPFDRRDYIIRADGNRPAPALGASGFVVLTLRDGVGRAGHVRLAAWTRTATP